MDNLESLDDYTTFSAYWLKPIDIGATILLAGGEGEALEGLRETAMCLGGWTPAVQAIGLRILKPHADRGEVAAK
jgi:hypothetical protein